MLKDFFICSSDITMNIILFHLFIIFFNNLKLKYKYKYKCVMNISQYEI